MSRYPFTDCLNEYMPVEYGHISYSTYGTNRRRLVQIGKIFHELKSNGRVSTDNPRKITARDIDAFVGYRKANGITNTTILKDLGLLKKMLSYFDNDAVSAFKSKYPAHYPKKYQKRAPAMEEPVVERILARAMEISMFDWKLSEAYGLVSLAICTGLRPKELRMMYVKNVHISGGTAEVLAIHVKGEDSYGNARWIPVHPDGVPILKRYLEAREFKLRNAGKTSEALFPPIRGTEEFIGYNMVEKLKKAVEEDIGETFELRKCRRTFGQRALDEGHDIHNVSLVMGHASITTTQRYYCDKDQHSASDEMLEFWQNTRQMEDA